MNFVSFADLARDVLGLVPFCLERDVSAIYGVPRSGIFPAAILATALHLPCGMAGDAARRGRRVNARPRVTRGPALLLDDTVNHGGSMKLGAEMMREPGFLRACVYVTPGSEGLVDEFVKVLPGPRLFQWNLFHSERTPRLMFDLDGVFCADPTVYDDDGAAYGAQIADASPLRLATWSVGWIATNRLERWRGVTEAWLSRYRIVVAKHLLMQPFATAAERRAASSPATFKAGCYAAARECKLFVESDEAQAVSIFKATGRPVLSLETMRCHQ